MTILIEGMEVITKLKCKGCTNKKTFLATSGLKVLVQSELVTSEIILMLISMFMLWK